MRLLIAMCFAVAFAAGTTAAVAGAHRAVPHQMGALGTIPSMEAALGMPPGGTRVIPQCGCTIRYIGARQIGPHTFDVRIEKLD